MFRSTGFMATKNLSHCALSNGSFFHFIVKIQIYPKLKQRVARKGWTGISKRGVGVVRGAAAIF